LLPTDHEKGDSIEKFRLAIYIFFSLKIHSKKNFYIRKIFQGMYFSYPFLREILSVITFHGKGNIKAAARIGIYWKNSTRQEWKLYRKPSECVPNPFTQNILVGFNATDGKLLDGKPIEQVRNEVAAALYGHKVVTLGSDDIKDIFGYEQEWQHFVEEMDHIDIQSEHFLTTLILTLSINTT
jgi:hypothetical protein